MARRPAVVTLGDINRDLFIRVRAFPRPGRDNPAESACWALGGSAANTAVCLARLGVSTAVVGRVGRDADGRTLVFELARLGVETRAVQTDRRRPTGFCVIPVGPEGERVLIGIRGANRALARDGIAEALEGIRHLHVSGYALIEPGPQRAALEALSRAKRAGATTSLDFSWHAAVAVPQAIQEALAQVTVALPSSKEIRRAMGEGEVRRAAQKALSLGADQVAVTLGARGSRVFLKGRALSPESSFRVPAFPVRAVNTCGAGDAFNAGYIYGLLRGASAEICAMLGNAAAAAAVGSDISNRAPARTTLIRILRKSQRSLRPARLRLVARESMNILHEALSPGRRLEKPGSSPRSASRGVRDDA